MRLRLTAGTTARAAGIAAITLLAAGCSATTRTRPFVLALDPATPRGARSLAVASATQAQDAARLYTVGVVEWGRFDEQDLANIWRSLADTIALHAPAIHQQAVVQRTMPMNNATAITDDERALIGRWFAAGAALN